MDRPDHEPDSFDVIHAESTVRVIVHRPSDLLTTQRYVWQALLSGAVAAGMQPLRVQLEVQPDGAIFGETSGAYHGWESDPQLDDHLEIIATVADAAMEAYGYHPLKSAGG